jgi:hypothetical protein
MKSAGESQRFLLLHRKSVTGRSILRWKGMRKQQRPRQGDARTSGVIIPAS